MINASAVQMATSVKQFLEVVQPLQVKYGYSRGARTGDAVLTYYQVGSTLNKGIGNQIVSERQTYLITVQTKTAEQCLLYSQLIRRGTDRSNYEYVSDSIRRDTTVENGWINSIVIYAYTSVEAIQHMFTAEEVREELQQIADRYLFTTSIYNETVAASFIDKLKIPKLQDREYTLNEFIALKQKYLDKLLLTTIVF